MFRLTLVVTLLSTTCVAEPGSESCDAAPVATIGHLAFETPTCPDPDCGFSQVYRDGEFVQLLSFDSNQGFLGEVRGRLAAEYLEQVDQDVDGVLQENLGEFEGECLTAVGLVSLNVPASEALVGFRHPLGCPPSGLAAIESRFHEITSALHDCGKDGIVEVDVCNLDGRPNHP